MAEANRTPDKDLSGVVEKLGGKVEHLFPGTEFEKTWYELPGEPQCYTKDELIERLRYPDEKSYLEVLTERYLKRRPFVVPDSSGGIGHYASSLGYASEEDFLADLEGKAILDLGSGRGLLAREVYLRHINCKVYSVEPKLYREGYEAGIAEKAAEYLASDYPVPPETLSAKLQRFITRTPAKNQFEEARKSHNASALATLANELPFVNNSFDEVLDVTAVSRYFGSHESHGGEDEKPIFKKYITEATRTLNPGGKLKIFDDAYGWKEPSWKEKALKELGVEYKLIFEPLSEPARPIGVEIRKPATPTP